MADNPLFPGYSPRYEGEIGNPLFPGYREGQRPYKPSGGSYLGSYEYNADYWLDQLDQMSFDIGNFPKWFVDRYIDDFKSNLKAVYNPETVPVEQMDDYDQDVFPGVSSISLSLDPADWKKPGELMEKTAKSWIRAGTGLRFKKEGWGLEAWPIDLTDYDTNVKTVLWKSAMGLQEEVSTLGEMGGRAIAGATRARAGDKTYGDRLFNFGDADYLVSNRKIYKQMASNAVEVQRFMQSGPKRDDKHDSFVSSMTSAISAEFGDYSIPKLDENGNVVMDQYDREEHITKQRVDIFKQLYGQGQQQRANDFENAVKIFTEKEALAADMDTPTSGAISGPFGITAMLKARLSGSTNEEVRGDTLEKLGGTQTRFEAQMESLKNTISQRLASSGDKSIDQRILRIRNIDTASAEAVQKYADDFKEYLSKVQEALNTYTGDDRVLLNKLSNITVNGRTLTGGGLFDPSIRRGLLRQLESDVTLPGKMTKVEKKFQLGTYLQEIEQLTTHPNENGDTIQKLFADAEAGEFKGFFANQARLVASRLESDRGSYAIEEFYDAVTQGKFMERYVWNRISKRLTGYTPGELVQNNLKKVGHFGLVIDDDFVSDGLKNSKVFNQLFRHKFNITIDNANNLFAGATTKIKASFHGSKKLAAVERLGTLTETEKPLTDDELIELISGTKQITKRVGGAGTDLVLKEKLPPFWNKDAHFIENVQKEIDNFRAWLAENGKAVGIDYNAFTNMDPVEQAKVLALFKSLNKENKYYGSLKITKEFSGMLQRIGVGLNKLQDKIFGSEVFKRLIKPLLQAKNIIAERISEIASTIISEILTKALHIASEGATAILDRVIEKVIKPLVRFIVRKVVEFSQNVTGAIATANVNAIMEKVDKDMQKLVKFSMYWIGIPLVLFALWTQHTTLTMVTTFSPIDPTKDNAGYGAATTYQGLSTSENAFVRIEKSVETLTYEGSFVNRVAPLDNSTVDSPNHIQVYYTVKVTAKQGFDAGSVTYTDVATRYGIDGSTSTIFSIGPKDLGAMNEGDVLELSSPLAFPPTSLSGDIYHDSLITNVFTLNFVGDLLIENLAPLQVSRTFGIGAVQSQVPGCESYPVGILPTKNTALNPSVPGDAIAIRAYEIALTLSRGFWCNFNNSSEYPEYFNSSLFASNPFPTYPGDIQDDVNALFWCSWLTAKSYRSVYPTFPDSPSLRYAQFSDTFVQNKTPGGPWVYKSRADTPYTEIHPGDAIFFERYPSDNPPNHIGIVYKVTPDGITTVESNNIVLSVYIPIGPDGKVAEAVEGALYVMGFGSHE